MVAGTHYPWVRAHFTRFYILHISEILYCNVISVKYVSEYYGGFNWHEKRNTNMQLRPKVPNVHTEHRPKVQWHLACKYVVVWYVHFWSIWWLLPDATKSPSSTLNIYLIWFQPILHYSSSVLLKTGPSQLTQKVNWSFMTSPLNWTVSNQPDLVLCAIY